MIKISGLTKKYGSGYAIRDLDFQIEDGYIYGFLGPNGAGKTTTMNIITGYLSASSGSVTVNGHDILKEPEEAKAEIGYLPETPPLYPEMTVYEYLMFTAELKKVPKQERRKQVGEIMELMAISDMKDKLIKNLSKGYRQRVGMAQAIVSYPAILILDEPTVGLDPKQIIEIRELIKSLRGKHTVILSSHILSEVSAVCDRILILSKGRLMAQGSPEELEHMMQGDDELILKVRLCGRAELEETLIEIPCVDSCDIREAADGEGELTVYIKTSDINGLKDVLSIRLAERGIAVTGLWGSEKSLEDIFLELTSADEISETGYAERISAVQAEGGKTHHAGREVYPGEASAAKKVSETEKDSEETA